MGNVIWDRVLGSPDLVRGTILVGLEGGVQEGIGTTHSRGEVDPMAISAGLSRGTGCGEPRVNCRRGVTRGREQGVDLVDIEMLAVLGAVRVGDGEQLRSQLIDILLGQTEGEGDWCLGVGSRDFAPSQGDASELLVDDGKSRQGLCQDGEGDGRDHDEDGDGGVGGGRRRKE